MARVEALDIRRNDYTLGKVLTQKQKGMARRNPLKSSSPGTYKFRDGDLHVVAHKATDRVIILYEQHDPATRERVRELVGSLFLDFGDPTVFAHDQIIYWAFDQKGKISEGDYLRAKDKKAKLNVLATVKLNSSLKIMANNTDVKEGSVYYVISSEPLLKMTKALNK